ncbi:pyrimidine reductase family protein [Subtercola sp. Z020]|uniref:pyrimidine reductase family protein n=1 Tax=Subtercola sp. Z020 TaxID=2080582 RepID=UPI000CE7C293|nr:pyrimidine reductase family protein [Subtercola sp. Z020]PPF86260.1 pyrimidine reductase family protein [Subtercola sp. Z020]
MSDEITRLFPAAVGGSAQDALTDAELLALYSPPSRQERLVRANFVSSVDGSATASGLSGGLGGPADKRVFDLLRQLSDVVLVGAGTVRSEGYGAMRLAPDAAAWRSRNGLTEHPVFALVSGRLDLDPASDVFAKAPVRPLVFTVSSAPAAARASLAAVADVIDCGATSLDVPTMLDALTGRGLSQIHCEGGPSLLGALIAADALDCLCLTTAPALEGGAGPRITRAGVDTELPLRALRLDHLLLAGSMLLSKYSRAR